MEILKNFAVLEGCDGSGTTTQLNILEKFFNQNRSTLPVFYKTFEPTNGSIGKLIRSALKKETVFCPETIALLFAADRNEHLYGPGGIDEHCKAGELVVSDRYLPSSLVYQGIACGEELPARLNRNFPAPELLIFLDIESEIAQKRISERKQREIFENPDFQIQVCERYKTLLPQLSAEGVRVEIINASLSPEEVAGEIWKAIEKMPILKG
jgi:dTMP kinase